jgi:hypothetical protein
MLSSPAAPQLALVRFGEPGDRGISETRFIDAAEAIAELEPIIPSPEVIRERERASRRRR